MQEFLTLHYPWLMALHIISVISWMAGLLYLPRLFVYHADHGHDIFKTMELKLMRVIMAPAMVLTWAFGILMVLANPSLLHEGWLHAKLALVILMTGFHHVLIKWRKDFVAGRNSRSAQFYRRVNEVPTVLMILIVILVVVKPF